MDTYDHSGYSARHALHIRHGHVSKPPGPKADKRCLLDNTESGLCWSMNCDNCEDPKNSLIAAVTGRMLMICCGVKTSLSCTDIRSRTFPVPSVKGQDALGCKHHQRHELTISKVVDIIYTANTFCKVQEIAHFCQDISWSHNPYFVRWVSISDDGDNAVWICWSDNFEFCNSTGFCQNSSIIWNVGDFVQTVIQLF